MSLLTDRCALLPLCLTLGTLLCALPAPADVPVVPAAPAAQAKTLALQNTVPKDILKALHWDQAAQKFDSAATIRVEGVSQISALPATNSLSVVATPDGFAKVQQLVKILDIAPRQVQIKFALANATAAELNASGIPFDLEAGAGPHETPILGYATGSAVARFLQTLTAKGTVTQSPVITTSNNVDASLNLTTTVHSQVVSSVTLAAMPRVNSDDTITLTLHPSFSQSLPGAPAAKTLSVKTLRTVKSGDTMVQVVYSEPFGKSDTNQLLFVTPTILSTDKGPAATTVK